MGGFESINWASIGTTGTIIALIILSITQILRDWMKARRESEETKLVLAVNESMNSLAQVFATYTLEDSHMKKELLGVLKIISNQYAEDLPSRQAEMLIRAKMDLLKYRIVAHVHSVITHNHIEDNEEDIKSKMNTTIANLFDTANQWLSEFKYGQTGLNELMEDEWAASISNCMFGMVKQKKSYLEVMVYLDNKFTKYSLSMIKNLKDE